MLLINWIKRAGLNLAADDSSFLNCGEECWLAPLFGAKCSRWRGQHIFQFHGFISVEAVASRVSTSQK